MNQNIPSHTIFGEDNYIQFSHTPMQILVSLIQFRQNLSAIKMTTILDLHDRQSPFIHFGTAQQLLEFIKNGSNYVLNFEQKTITFKWQICGNNYIRNIQCKKELEASQLNDKQSLQCQIMVLKKKIGEYQRKCAMRIRKKHIKNLQQNKQDQPESNSDSVAELQNHQIVTFDDKQDESEEQKQDKRKSGYPNEHKTKPIQKQKRKYHRREKTEPQNTIIERKKRGPKGPRKEKKQLILSQKKDLVANQSLEWKDKNIKQKQTAVTPKQSQNSKYLQFQIQSQVQELSNDSGKKQFANETQKGIKLTKNSQRLILGNNFSNLRQNQANSETNIINIEQHGNKFKVFFKNGDFYMGEMKDGVYHGQGLYYSVENGSYQGEWRNGVGEGFGVSTDINHNKYTGMHSNDRKHGKGIDQFSTGERYEGNFVNGSRQGHGVYYFMNGDVFEGEWRNDLQHGKGKYTWANGVSFEGQWSNDQKNGYGIQYGPFGNQEQIWSNGVLIHHKFLVKVEEQI